MTGKRILCLVAETDRDLWKQGYGGWGGIRTHGELAPTPVFKTGALNRSATHPERFYRPAAQTE